MSLPIVRLLLTMAVCTGGATLPGRLLADPLQVPELSSFQPVVLRVNETNPLTLKGKHLVAIKSVWTSRHGVVPVEQLEVKPNEKGTSTTLKLAVNPTTACGPFALRIITDAGVSQPRIGFLEALREMKISDDRMIAGTGYLNDTLRDPAGVTFRVSLEHDQELPIEVFAGRIGSKLDPVLTIHNSSGREELHVQDSPGVGVDCWHLFKAPEKDVYTIRIRDVRYGRGGAYRFHVRFGHAIVTSSPRVRGSKNFQLSSTTSINIPAPETDRFFESFLSENTTGQQLGIAIQSGNIEASAGSLDPTYALIPVSTNVVGQIRNQLEHVRNETIQPHYSLNGLFKNPDELMKFKLEVEYPGRYRWTAISRRLGGWSDPAMRLKTEDGQLIRKSRLFRNESTLAHEFKEPGDYILEIWDAAGQFGAHASFHLQSQKNPPEFELNSETDSLRIKPGKTAELKLAIDRDGYRGPVKFAIATPSEAISLSDAVAKRNSKEKTIKLTLDKSARPGTTFPIKISGHRGDKENAARSPLYTQAYWKTQFKDLYSPMFEFEDTIWITVLPSTESEDKTENPDEAR